MVNSLNLDVGEASDRPARRLNFSRTNFYGRQEELGLLLNSFRRLTSQEKHIKNQNGSKPGSTAQQDGKKNPALTSNNTEIVVIRGKSGSGKTRLVSSFRHEIEQMVETGTAPPCFFVKGKSNEPLAGQTAAEPYSSLSDALTDLCSEILLLDEEDVEVLQSRILDSVAGDVHQYQALCNIVPALDQVLFQAQINQPITAQDNPPITAQDNPLEQHSYQSSSETLQEISPLEKKANALKSSIRSSLKKKSSISPARLRSSLRSSDGGLSMTNHTRKQKKPADAGSKTNEQNRLKFLFQTFLRAVCTKERPLVLFMDDLHWADVSTIGLLNLLLTDKSMKHLLLLVTVREEDQNDDSNFFEDLSPHIDCESMTVTSATSHSVASNTYYQTKNEAFELFMAMARGRQLPLYQPMLELQLGSVTAADISAFLEDLLELPLGEVEGLAQVLHQKTAGNIFYVKALLQWLEQNKLLTWSTSQSIDSVNPQSDEDRTQQIYRWTWDIAKVVEQASVTENFVAMVLSKLKGLETSQRYILSRAALLKSSFTVYTLYGLLAADVSSWSRISFPKSELVQKLEILVQEGLLENCSTPGSKTTSEKYQFSHDKIQEAAALLVEGYERDKLLYTAGMYLLELDSSNESVALLGLSDQTSPASPSSTRAYLAGVDHLNAINDWSLIHDRLGVEKLVSFNLSAAKKSAHVAAFPSAQAYIGIALELVDEMGVSFFWDKHYSLCYELHVLAADVESTVGTIEQAEDFAREVIEHSKTVEEQLPVQWALAESLGRRDEHWLALQTHELILKILSFSPRSGNIFNLLFEVLAIKRLFARHTNDDILALPPIADSRVLMALDALSSLVVRSYYCGKKLYSVCCAAKIVRMTFEYGLSPIGALGFCQLGSILLGPLNDEPLGIRMSELSLKLLDLTEATKAESRLLFVYSGYIEPYINTLDSALDVCVKGYTSGVRVGDMEFASLNGQSGIITAFNSGIALSSIVQNTTILTTMMDQYEIKSVAVLLRNYALLPEGLFGSIDNPFYWVDGEKERLKQLRRIKLEQTVAFELFYEYMAKCQLAYYLGEYEVANEMYTFVERFEYMDHGLNWAVYSRFYGFLICTAMYRKSCRLKYHFKARFKRGAIKAILKTKGHSEAYLMTLMNAEFDATFGGKPSRVENMFLEAITAITDARRISHLALANELLGQYYCRVSGNEQLAKNHLQDCYLQYDVWGAKAKTKQLRTKYEDLIDPRGASSNRRALMNEFSASMALSDVRG